MIAVMATVMHTACSDNVPNDNTQQAAVQSKEPVWEISAQEGILYGPVKRSTMSVATDVYSTSNGEWFYNDVLDNKTTTAYDRKGIAITDSLTLGSDFSYSTTKSLKDNIYQVTSVNNKGQKFISSIKIIDGYHVENYTVEINKNGDTLSKSFSTATYKDALHYTTVFMHATGTPDTVHTAFDTINDTIYLKKISNNPIFTRADTMIILERDRYRNPVKTLLLHNSKNLILSSHEYYE